MVEVAGSLASRSLSAALDQVAKPGAGTPSVESVERFAQAMSEPSAAVQTVPAATEGGTPGDAILGSLDRMRSGFDKAAGDLSHAIEHMESGDVASTSEMFRVQLELTQVTLQQELTSKVGGKLTQDLDSFLKNQ